MSMTDRVSDNNLIQLAKQQYEQQKRNTIPSEIMTLVSQGKVYPKDHPLRSGKIEMRYMTAYDEDILTNPSYLKEGVVLDKLLEALIVTPVDYSTITRIDKDGLIIGARIVSYGKDYAVVVKDPTTKKDLTRTIDLTKLKHSEFTLESDDNGEFDYTLADGTELKFKFLINSDHGGESISELLHDMITQVNGSRTDASIQEFIRYKFLAKDAKQFRTFVEQNTPTIIMAYEFEGDSGGTFTAGFQVGANLFWF